MSARQIWPVSWLLAGMLASTPLVLAQAPAGGSAPGASAPAVRDKNWRSADRSNGRGNRASAGTASAAAGGIAPIEPLRDINQSPRRPIASVKQGIDSLPNEFGQVWREYDISPYTLRVTSTKRPEQAIVDWIFRETGYEAWHAEKVACLSADTRTLKVYHTPEMQAVVADVVDRFVNTEAETQSFSIRVITVDHPNWRSKAERLLRPVQVQTPGVQAWLLAKEDTALLLAELRRRTDFREHSSPHLLVNNGQSTVVSSTRARTYVRDILPRAEVWPGFQTEMGQIDEGYGLEFSPLLSIDGRTVDAAIKCNIDQVERLIPVMIDAPTPVAQRQRTQIDVLQTSQFRLHERFRWPADQVLLVGLGVVATPVPTEPGALRLGLPIFAPPRADLLIFLEDKGKMGQPPSVSTASPREAMNYRNRY